MLPALMIPGATGGSVTLFCAYSTTASVLTSLSNVSIEIIRTHARTGTCLLESVAAVSERSKVSKKVGSVLGIFIIGRRAQIG